METDGWTVRRALAHAGLVPLEAQVLLAHALAKDRAWLVAHATDPLPRDALDRFFQLARRRREGEPVAYLTGRREFRGLDLEVTSAVLIPRPETETVIDAALARLPRDGPLRLLDLGTGSGAIALALAHALPRAQVLGVDVSATALAVARANGARLGLPNARFVQGDWYSGLPQDARFDAILANPPYVAEGDPHLAQGDLRFEPAAALAAGADGLAALRRIVAGARARLAAQGWLIVEHGYDQQEAVEALFRADGFAALASLRDLAGIPRVAAGRAS